MTDENEFHDAELDDENDADRPRDLDELRLRLIRRLADHERNWRRCRIRACRRAKRCIDAALVCVPPSAPVAVTEQQNAEAMASLRRGLDDERARRARVRVVE